MKAIIVAAGPGSRLRPLTDDKPKCLLDINGKTILRRTLDVLRENGMSKIIVVRGYKGNKIHYPDVTYYENPDFNDTNLLKSLFCAEAEMDDDIVVSYSDIIYGSEIAAQLVENKADIGLIVDVSWAKTYEGRDQHPVAEAELVKVEDGKVVRIGKGVIDPEDAHGEFIGLAKFSKSGVETMKTVYHLIERERPSLPFQSSPSLDKAYLNDMLQELIDTGSQIHTVDINGGWIEIDTPQDLAEARKRFPRTG